MYPGEEKQKGVLFMLGAYLIWGLHPIYWKLLQSVPSMEVLYHRVIWCFVGALLIVAGKKQLGSIRAALQLLWQEKIKGLFFLLASMMLLANWLTNILAVQSGHIVESSLGSYINPLVNVLLGVVFLKEKLSGWQKMAVLSAFFGVLNLGIYQSNPPWISLGIAFSFGFYGLFKKKVGLDALTSTTLESGVMSFFSLFGLLYLLFLGESHFGVDGYTTALLIGAGPITLLPLLLFAAGLLCLSLSVVGFLQYLNPTVQLLLGICLYQEPFTRTHAVSFSLIWLSVFLFSFPALRAFLQKEK